MEDVINQPIDRFACPVCGNKETRYRNVWRSHWFYCDKCMVTWLEGSNLFSDWREETEEDWERNAYFLSKYKEVARFK